MTGFEPQTSAVWSNRSTNWATTTAPLVQTLLTDFETLEALMSTAKGINFSSDRSIEKRR